MLYFIKNGNQFKKILNEYFLLFIVSLIFLYQVGLINFIFDDKIPKLLFSKNRASTLFIYKIFVFI